MWLEYENNWQQKITKRRWKCFTICFCEWLLYKIKTWLSVLSDELSRWDKIEQLRRWNFHFWVCYKKENEFLDEKKRSWLMIQNKIMCYNTNTTKVMYKMRIRILMIYHKIWQICCDAWIICYDIWKILLLTKIFLKCCWRFSCNWQWD